MDGNQYGTVKVVGGATYTLRGDFTYRGEAIGNVVVSGGEATTKITVLKSAGGCSDGYTKDGKPTVVTTQSPQAECIEKDDMQPVIVEIGKQPLTLVSPPRPCNG